MSAERSREKMSKLSQMIKDAQIVGLEAYGGSSIEYHQSNKETIGLMIAMDEIKDVNVAILEELKKLNGNLSKDSIEIVEEEKVELIKEEIVVEDEPKPKGRPPKKQG